MFFLAYAILIVGLILAVPLLGWRRRWKASEARYAKMREYYRGKWYNKRRLGTKNKPRVGRGKRFRPKYPYRGQKPTL